MRISAIWGFALAVSMAQPAAAQSVRDGIDAWAAGNYVEAVTIWRPLADSGDADAAFNMGQAYRMGRGVGIDNARAQRYFESAARQGHLDAEVNLGLMLFSNGDKVNAMRWLRSASSKSDPRAMLVYGTALYNGDGVPRDPVAGYAYVKRAADTGLDPARRTLSELDRLLSDEIKTQGTQLAARQQGLAQTPREATARPTTPAPSAKPKAVTPSATAKATPPPAPKPTPKPTAAPPPAPKPAPAATASAASTATGPWRLQLGAFSKSSSASALYDKVKGNAALSGKRSFLVDAGNVTRLQVGPFASRAAANAACKRLQQSGQACFPVKAN
ncbi:tetratricopeptide repeat protein [Sphingomicrobium marinum]|uniref:tetratricopeptide repeat protein n=1 Tax=Sphingomicrobium marinum TaxID=1227950 RepID=UPI0022401C8B|nr:tetratricopeptide repeat protein [Sphingomicrobium marinum]